MNNILIQSKDRTSGESHNFTWKADDYIEGCYVLKHISIPNTIYNITSDNNKFILSGVECILESGSYNAGTLTTLLKDGFELASVKSVDNYKNIIPLIENSNFISNQSSIDPFHSIIPSLTDNNSHVGYTASASSSRTDSPPYLMFDGDITTFWCCGNNLYSSDTALYEGSVKTIVDGIEIYGEWIQMEFGDIKVVSSLKLNTPNTNKLLIVYDNGDGLWHNVATIGSINTNVPLSNHNIPSGEYWFDVGIIDVKKIRLIIIQDNNSIGCYYHLQAYTHHSGTIGSTAFYNTGTYRPRVGLYDNSGNYLGDKSTNVNNVSVFGEWVDIEFDQEYLVRGTQRLIPEIPVSRLVYQTEEDITNNLETWRSLYIFPNNGPPSGWEDIISFDNPVNAKKIRFIIEQAIDNVPVVHQLRFFYNEGDTYDCIINSNNGKLSITSRSNTNFTLSFPNELNLLLGLSDSLSGNYTYTSEKFINLTRMSLGMDIEESDTTNIINGSDHSKKSTIYIPFESSFGGFNFISSQDFKQYIRIDKKTKYLNVSLRDLCTNKILNLNGSDFEFIISKVV